MDGDSVSVLSYRRLKPQGKVRRRLQHLRIPSASYVDCTAGGHRLDLSHNESARMAVDSLLSRGLREYQQVLRAEGEVDFLSQPEKMYIMENGRDGSTGFSWNLFKGCPRIKKKTACLWLNSGVFFVFSLIQLDPLHLMSGWKACLLIPSLAHSVLHCPLTVILLLVGIRAARQVICE